MRYSKYTKESTRIEDGFKLPYGKKAKYKCQYCSDEFTARNPLAKYCSRRCRNDKQIEVRKYNALLDKNTKCLMCSIEINESKLGRNKKYCSASCKQKAYRVKNVTK